MLEHASGSLPISTMVILRPLLGVSDPWYQISFLALGRRARLRRELQQPGRRGTTRFFGTGSRMPMDWAASAIKPGVRASTGRAWTDCPEWLSSKQARGRAVM